LNLCLTAGRVNAESWRYDAGTSLVQPAALTPYGWRCLCSRGGGTHSRVLHRARAVDPTNEALYTLQSSQET